MSVREHKSQHDHVESLPLISDSATVTDVHAMDRDRRSEVRNALRKLGATHGFAEGIAERGPIDWNVVFERATRAKRNLAPRIGALHDRFERAHPALVRITLETDEPVGHAAGQYISVRYDDRTRPYSIASSPTRPETEFCVRRVPEGRLSSKLCDDLSVGDRVTVRGPHGHLLLEDVSSRDLVFLATGTGVAPIKSMIDYTFEAGRDRHRGELRNVWLFLGAAWIDDLPYHDAFADRAAQRENFNYVPCLSREPWLSDWDGETEYIQDALLKYVDERDLADAAFGRHMAEMLADRSDRSVGTSIDPHDLEVYACGINAMVYSLEKAVRRLGVPEQHIHCEGYG